MSTTSHDTTRLPTEPLELLRLMLEDDFAAQTRWLTQLTVYARLPRHSGDDQRTLDALTASARQRIADTAYALKRMTDDTYGVCVGCHRPIPLGRLRAAPFAARCALCERVVGPTSPDAVG